jgi:hypothetical protein
MAGVGPHRLLQAGRVAGEDSGDWAIVSQATDNFFDQRDSRDFRAFGRFAGAPAMLRAATHLDRKAYALEHKGNDP